MISRVKILAAFLLRRQRRDARQRDGKSGFVKDTTLPEIPGIIPEENPGEQPGEKAPELEIPDVPAEPDFGVPPSTAIPDWSISGKAVMGGTGYRTFSPLATYSREQAFATALRLLHCQ